MPDIPEPALAAAALALQCHVHGAEPDPWRERARVVLEAAAPLLADHVAGKILDHMAGLPAAAGSSPGRARERYLRIAARIAAMAFMAEADLKREAAAALKDVSDD